MSLANASTKLLDISGRPDLDPSTAPTPALNTYWYLNEAQKMLDRQMNEGKIAARYAIDVVAGQILVPIYGCRAIKKVFVHDASERTELAKVDVQTLRASYPNPKANLTTGLPEYYTPICAKPYPMARIAGDVTYAWVLEEILETAKRATYNAILIMPPPDVTYTLDIWGIWYTEKLTSGTDTSYWTEENEGLLLNAAMFKLEVQYRNNEGAKGWKEAIDLEISELIKDQIEEEVAEINQMRG